MAKTAANLRAIADDLTPKETISQVCAKANGVELGAPDRHDPMQVVVTEDMKPGSLTDRCMKAAAARKPSTGKKGGAK